MSSSVVSKQSSAMAAPAADAVIGYAAHDSSGRLSPFTFSRRAVGSDDVAFKITHCGLCHTDLHQMRNDWKNATYPMVPGHEIVGIVTKVGSDVTDFKEGDHVGVGCLVRSCGECDACEKSLEQHCPKAIYTYNSVDTDGTITYGGYSTHMVTNKKFVLRIPEGLALDVAGPLLCAGISVYSPMKYFGMTEEGKHLGVVGLGGLGHMAVKFAKAFNLKVTVISTSPRKEQEAKQLLGADAFLVSSDKNAMQKFSKSLDYIIDTVAAPHDIVPLLNLLSLNGKLVCVGIPDEPFVIPATALITGRRLVAGSVIGGLEETQEMLNFCAEKSVTPIIEKISPDYLNTAFDRLIRADVKYRFVVDFGGLACEENNQ